MGKKLWKERCKNSCERKVMGRKLWKDDYVKRVVRRQLWEKSCGRTTVGEKL